MIAYIFSIHIVLMYLLQPLSASTEKLYHCYDGSSIVLSGEKLIYHPYDLIHNRSIPPSECTIEKLTGHFYLVSSVLEPIPNVIHEYSIAPIYDKPFPWVDDNDIRIVFDIPSEDPLKVSLENLSGKEQYSFILDKNNHSLVIPRDSLGGSLSVRITPDDIFSQDNSGRYYGIVEVFLYASFLGSPYELRITIPGLDSAYFERNQINNEIIMINRKEILWRGKSFVRSK